LFAVVFAHAAHYTSASLKDGLWVEFNDLTPKLQALSPVEFVAEPVVADVLSVAAWSTVPLA